MSGEVEKCPILHVCPKFDVFTLLGLLGLPEVTIYNLLNFGSKKAIYQGSVHILTALWFKRRLLSLTHLLPLDLSVDHLLTFRRGWTGGYPTPSSLPLFPHFPPPSPPLPSPFYPTSLPLSDFSLPLIKCCSYSRTKAYICK